MFALVVVILVSHSGRMLALDPASHISQYGHTAWRLQDGYFGGQPYSITQTKDGYIWVGTRDGLFRFDGVQFVRWRFPSGEKLPSSFVISLLAARDGTLWIGTDAGLARMVNNHLTVHPKGEGWFVDYILEDREGRIWIDRAREGDRTHPLCQVLDSEIRCHGKEDGLDSVGTGALLQDTSGDLWVGGSTTLVRWRKGDSQVYRPRALMSNAGQAGVTGLAAAPDGSLWVGTEVRGPGAGLQRMVEGTLKPFVAPGLNGETLIVSSLNLDRENSLWVGTSEGIYRIRGAAVDHFGTTDGLSGDFVLQFFEDSEGNLWLVTPDGVDMFRDLRVKSISKHEGLEEEVQSILASRDGRILVGSSHLSALKTDGTSSGLERAPRGHMITSLLEDHAGHLWIGVDNTLSVYEGGGYRLISKRDGSPVGMVAGIAEDSETNIWIESLGPPRTLMRIRDLAVQQEFPAPEMPLARKLVADPQSGIWLGLVSGDLARYRSGQLTTFAFGDHPRSQVWAIAEGSDGSILGATGFGVVGWKNGKRQILTTRNGLPCNSVYALISDNEENQWLYAQCGLLEIPKGEMSRWWDQPETKLKLKMFDALDGVRPGYGNFSNSAKTPDGRLWFANGSVVQVIDPAHMTGNTLPPPVYVNSLIADHKSYPIDGAILLPALTRDLELDYTALSYALPQRVTFRYMLEGRRDTKWEEPGTRRQAFYTDLGPGRYRFRVIASNNDGVWNETGAFLDFSIEPAYYQTTWFRLCCAAAVLLFLWAAYQLRVRQLQRQFAIGLEARVSERTRIARELHDTLLQSLHGLMFQFQAVRNLMPRRPDDAMQTLDDAIKDTKKALAESRNAIQELRSEPMSESNLAEMLMAESRELAQLRNENDGSPKFELTEEGERRALSLTAQNEVRRIVSEILINAYRHADAHRIEAEVRYGDQMLRLRIRDDGKGIDPVVLKEGGRAGHWGIRGVRERAEQLGARIDFWSEVGAGTEVELEVPASLAYEKEIAE